MLKIDDGTKSHDFSGVDELFRFIDDLEFPCTITMTTPDDRVWRLYFAATAGKGTAKMICLSTGDFGGTDRVIESLDDIVDFLDSLPMSGLVLQARYKVFDVSFAGFAR